MAFDKSALTKYVKENQDILVSASMLKGRTASMLRLQTGIKTSERIHGLNVGVEFQKGDTCGFSAKGNDAFSERVIETGLIKINKEWCERDLLSTYAEYLVRISATADSLPFEEYIMNKVNESIDELVEKAIWQGDTASDDENLNKFDGLIKIIDGESDSVKVSIPAGTSAYDAVKKVYMAIPEQVIDKATIFVGADTFRSLVQDLVSANLYHFNPGAPVEDVVIPGTATRVVKVNGLNGKNKVYAFDTDNAFLGVDLLNGREEYKLWFSDDADVWRLKVLFNMGTQVGVPSEVVAGTIATA